MTTTRKALGKGLRSLIPEAPARVPKASAPEPVPRPGAGEPIQLIDIDRIRANPKQPRQREAQRRDTMSSGAFGSSDPRLLTERCKVSLALLDQVAD